MLNRRLLRKIIKERGIGIGEMARVLGIKGMVLRSRLWGCGEFRLWEIVRILEILKIDKEMIEKIFFA